MTAKKAHTDTMNLLVVPFGFCTGTELLNTRPHSSHMALPMVKDGPCGSENKRQRSRGRNKTKVGKILCWRNKKGQNRYTLNSHFQLIP